MRTPKRSLAERERGFESASRSLGSIGWPRGTSNVGSASAGSPGKSREAAPRRPERLEKNCLTMRSSSEWNVTAASRPPGFKSRSAAESPRASSPSSSLTAMRKAWKARVAGWVNSPRRAGATRAMSSASCRVEVKGCSSPVGDDGAGDAAGGALLAEMKENVGDRGLVLVAQDVGGRAPVSLHAHVEGRLEAQREAARRLVELHRRNPDVEHDAVGRLDAEALGDRVEIAEARFDELKPPVRRSDERRRLPESPRDRDRWR